MAAQSADVVIIGVGAAGGILARDLARAGLRVVGLERGPRLETKDFEPHDELRFFQRMDLRPDPKRQPVTWRPNVTARATPLGQLNYGNQAGGGTVHYGAVSWRFLDEIFHMRSHNLARYGPGAIPEDASVVDWPLDYAELEPYYDRAEYEIGISGKAGNLRGQRIDGGNVFESPRQREYPLPPLEMDQSAISFDQAARELGRHPFSTPRAIISRPYQGRPACTYCGFCQSFGCHVAAKSSVLVTHLPDAEATGNFDLRTGAMVYRLNSDSSGRIGGVSYYGPDGSDQTIDADLVILSTFIYDNTRLLLLSATDRFPNGLANSSGEVGKHLTAHMMANVYAAFNDKHMNLFMGPNAQKHSIDDFEADNFDHAGLGFIQGAQISLTTAYLEGGPICTAIYMPPPPGIPRWGAAYRDFIAKHFTRHVALVGQTENLPYPDQTIDLDPNVRDQFGLSAPRLTYDWRRPTELARVEFTIDRMQEVGRAMGADQVWAAPLPPPFPGAHHEGGTRMGNDPTSSVVNKYSQSWDHPNLFIMGSSTFPTMSGHNPTETIQALAYHTADAILNHYVRSPGPLA